MKKNKEKSLFEKYMNFQLIKGLIGLVIAIIIIIFVLIESLFK